jgi:hypothetical protein
MPDTCSCQSPPFDYTQFVSTDIGIDKTEGRFAEVRIKTCKKCAQKWLHYFFEIEGQTGSGRWYRGAISNESAEAMTAEHAAGFLEGLESYFVGGSYFGSLGTKGSGSIR